MHTLFDTHCHLDVDAFAADRSAVLQRCHELGVNEMVVPAIQRAGWDGLLRLCAGAEGLYPALGLHPVYLEQHEEGDIKHLADYASRAPVVAIGEIGLDYFVKGLDRERQQALFEAQLRVARDLELPVLLHIRKAHDEVLAMLRRLKLPAGGIAHAFNGSEQQARQFIELGFMLGIGGVITYERASKIRKLAKSLPLENLVLETDAPDMVPAQHRGKRNSPEYLCEVLEMLAELREQEAEQIAHVTTVNARRLFKLSVD